MSKARHCHICGTECTSWCPTCLEAFRKRWSPDQMTPGERADELERLRGPIEIPPRMFYTRIEELSGRRLRRSGLLSLDMPKLIKEVRRG